MSNIEINDTTRGTRVNRYPLKNNQKENKFKGERVQVTGQPVNCSRKEFEDILCELLGAIIVPYAASKCRYLIVGEKALTSNSTKINRAIKGEVTMINESEIFEELNKMEER